MSRGSRFGRAALLILGALLPVGLSWAAPLQMTEIAPGVHVHQGVHEEFGEHYHGDIANIGFVIGRDAVAVIDTGGSYRVGLALREAIRVRTSLPIRFVINTHVHSDHIFGNAAFEQDQPAFIGHHQLPRAMRLRAEDYTTNILTMLGDAAAGSRIVLPTQLVNATTEIDLGERVLTLRAWQPAHTDHDLTVWDAKTGALWCGDLLFAERAPSIDGDIHGWLTVMSELATLPVSLAIPGHGPVSPEKNAVLAKQRQYLQTLLDDLRRSIKEGKSMTQTIKSAAQSEREHWILFDGVNARNATLLFPALEWE